MRVVLPDVPGSLGTLASALGRAGADIEAIEVVERRPDDTVVDDVLLELPPRVMPDALVTACHALDGVEVEWISRYNAGANLSRDLEAVEHFTADPSQAVQRMTAVLPDTFRADWALVIERGPAGTCVVRSASPSAPELVPTAETWLHLESPRGLPPAVEWDSTVLVGAPASDRDGHGFVVVLGRRGGPAFLDSEIARVGHMASLAASVQTT